jgi:cobalt-zinc-cadmium efflux system outer membrane protein
MRSAPSPRAALPASLAATLSAVIGCGAVEAPPASPEHSPRVRASDRAAPTRDAPAPARPLSEPSRSTGASPGPRPDLGPLSLERALALAEAENPALRAAEQALEGARGREEQAGLLPNPELSLTSLEGPLYRGFGRSINVASVSIPLPVGGRLSAALAAAAKAREQAEQDLLLARRTLRSEVKAAFAVGLTAQERRAVAAELADLAEQARRVTERRVQAGDLPEAELLKAEVETERFRLDLTSADSEVAGAKRRTASLLGRPEATIARFEGALATLTAAPPLGVMRERTLATSPRLASAMRSWERARLDLLAAERERLSDFTVTLGAGSSREVRAENDFILEAGISLPLPVFNRNQGRIAEAQAQIGRAAREAEACENETLRDLAEAHRRHELALHRAARFREQIIPRAERALEQARRGYEAGKLRLLDVLDAQRTLGETRGLAIDAARDAAIARAELEIYGGE